MRYVVRAFSMVFLVLAIAGVLDWHDFTKAGKPTETCTSIVLFSLIAFALAWTAGDK